jgi:hypothetical protein
VTSNIWFTINLSQARSSLAATSSTNKIFFGGGGVIGKGLSNIVDIIGTPTSSNFTGGNSQILSIKAYFVSATFLFREYSCLFFKNISYPR